MHLKVKNVVQKLGNEQFLQVLRPSIDRSSLESRSARADFGSIATFDLFGTIGSNF